MKKPRLTLASRTGALECELTDESKALLMAGDISPMLPDHDLARLAAKGYQQWFKGSFQLEEGAGNDLIMSAVVLTSSAFLSGVTFAAACPAAGICKTLFEISAGSEPSENKHSNLNIDTAMAAPTEVAMAFEHWTHIHLSEPDPDISVKRSCFAAFISGAGFTVSIPMRNAAACSQVLLDGAKHDDTDAKSE